MTKKISINTLGIAFLISFFTIASACAQVDDTEARKNRIKANLLFLFPQLETHQVEIGDFEDMDATGMQLGRFVVDGQQQQPFITNADDTKLYLLAGGPFDVSKTEADLAVEMNARKEEEKEKAKVVNEEMKLAIADLPFRGSADAPVTIVEFSDFQCPYCARATDTMHKLIDKHGDKVKLVYVQFPLESIHPWARPASIASICASNQSSDAFWLLHDKYFEDQGELSVDNVIERSKGYLAGTDVEMGTWTTCATDPSSETYKAASGLVDTSLQLGMKHGVNSTPIFFVNGIIINGAQPLEAFEAAIEDAMED
ncbi:MAG: DsbA family protein [Rhodothermales bacterium]